jgi:threonine/homoserine/homoserine lactone efflux protein
MVPMNQFLAFTLATIVFVAIPGPSVLFTIGRALTVGRRAALLTVAGNAAGVYLHVVAVAFGLGAIVERSVVAFTVLKYVGAGYLIYLGVQAIRHRRSGSADMAATIGPRRTWRVLRDGFVVGVGNPKSVVYFAAVLPQFIDPAAGNPALQMLTLGAVAPLIALLSDSGWALIAGTARDWFARSPRRLAFIGGTGGFMMIGLGVSLAVSGRKD